jgi:polyketide synthase 13
LADGDSIRAVIRGTGVSSDGKTNGITLPSEWGQKQALQMAYEDAGLRPQDTYYVEAHGAYTATVSIAQSADYIGQGREQRLVIERKPLFGWTPSCAAAQKIFPW